MVWPHVDNHGFGLGLQRSHIYWISFTAFVCISRASRLARLDRYLMSGQLAHTLEILLQCLHCHTFIPNIQRNIQC